MITRCNRFTPSSLLAATALLLAAGCVETDPHDGHHFEYGDETEGEDGLDDGGEGDEGDAGSEGADENEGQVPELPPALPLPPTGSDEGDEGGQGDAGGQDEGSEDEGGACLEFSDVLAPVPPSVLLLLDRSGSMMDTGFNPDQPDKSRWEALYEGVEAVMTTDELQTSIEFGAKTFSTQGMGACGVSQGIEVPFELDNASILLNTIPGPNEMVNGGTPTQAAVAAALDHMRGYEAEGSKVVVLVTDGSIGCTEDSAATLAEIAGDITSAREIDGISTYVVGIAPQWNSTKAQLQTMAEAGGTGDYYGADDAEALGDALDAVVAASYEDSCLLQLDDAPSAPELTVVEAGGMAWPEVQTCEEGDGWMWTNDDLTRMRLCNAACDALLDTKEVHVEYHCNPG